MAVAIANSNDWVRGVTSRQFVNNVTAGNVMVAVCGSEGPSQTLAVSDGEGSWTEIAQLTTDGDDLGPVGMFYKVVTAGQDATKPTASIPFYGWIAVAELSGVDATTQVDSYGTASGTGNATAEVSALTATDDGAYGVLVGGADSDAFATSYSTLIESFANGFEYSAYGADVLPFGGSNPLSFEYTGGAGSQWWVVGAVFKVAAAEPEPEPEPEPAPTVQRGGTDKRELEMARRKKKAGRVIRFSDLDERARIEALQELKMAVRKYEPPPPPALEMESDDDEDEILLHLMKHILH